LSPAFWSRPSERFVYTTTELACAQKTKGCGCGGTAQLAGKHVFRGKMIAVELAGLAPRPKQPPHGIPDARTAW